LIMQTKGILQNTGSMIQNTWIMKTKVVILNTEKKLQ
jgi:hypothetical protein